MKWLQIGKEDAKERELPCSLDAERCKAKQNVEQEEDSSWDYSVWRIEVSRKIWSRSRSCVSFGTVRLVQQTMRLTSLWVAWLCEWRVRMLWMRLLPSALQRGRHGVDIGKSCALTSSREICYGPQTNYTSMCLRFCSTGVARACIQTRSERFGAATS